MMVGLYKNILKVATFRIFLLTYSLFYLPCNDTESLLITNVH